MLFILLLILAFVWNKAQHGRYGFHNFTQRDPHQASLLGAALALEDWRTAIPQASHGDVWDGAPHLIDALH